MAIAMGLVIPLVKIDLTMRVKRCRYAKSKVACVIGTSITPALFPAPSQVYKHVKENGLREGLKVAHAETLKDLGETLTESGLNPEKLVTGFIGSKLKEGKKSV